MLVLVAAWGVWTYLVPHSHPVPAVTGESLEDANAALHDLGFTVVIADGRYDAQPKGIVLSVDPAQGTSLREGETVTLVPSLGPPPVPVPDVTGTTLDAAGAALGVAGLKAGDVHQVYSDHVADGDVVKQDPANGQAPRGSAVDLWVSKGHAPVAVPAVVGKKQDAAERKLRAAGFTPVVQVAFSDEVERGRVISVVPAEAAMTAYGSPVTITVSQGPETFAIPRFTGLSPSAAESLAKQYGLRVSFFDVPGTPHTTVISQIPSAGTTVRYGDTVTLYVA